MDLDKPLITIPAHQHTASAPTLRYEDFSYLAYFENQDGEQLVFAVERETGLARLYHSDIGWHPRDVEDGDVPLIILSDQERTWLNACWRASSYIRTGEFAR